MLKSFHKFGNIMTKEEKQNRHFSETFKKEKVRMLEQKQITVTEISRLYEVTRGAVYKWKSRYGTMASGERVVVEKHSEAAKTLVLLEQLKNREQEIGRQQVEIRYLREVISYWNRELGDDLEKKVERPL